MNRHPLHVWTRRRAGHWILPALLLACPAAVGAQEFSRQELLVAPFHTDSTPAAQTTARRVAELLRDRMAKRINSRDAHVLESYHLGNLLRESDYSKRAVLNDTELRLVATKLRADETVSGRVTARPGAVTIRARLARLKNWGLSQPLPVVRAATPELAVGLLTEEVMKARAQLPGLRRCENALTRGDRTTAVREAERAIQAYAQAVPARDCLLSALFDGRTSADSLLVIADDALAIDSANSVAAVARAQVLEALNRRPDAAAQWSRVDALHPDSLPLVIASIDGLLRVGQPRTALDIAQRMLRSGGPNAQLRRLSFRALTSLADWPRAASVGDSLELEDDAFRADSNYATRYVEALRQTGDSLAALELSVRNVRRFPGDSRLYLQYLQLLGREDIVALPRGLTRFPDVPEFHVLAANAARKAGNRSAAMRATREAIRRDSTLTPQYLALAEFSLEEQQLDSAVAVLSRAPRSGEAVEMLRSYAIARGLALLRAAGDTMPPQQRTAVTMLALADSIASRDDSRAYLAAASLQYARNQLVTASRARSCPDLQASNHTLGITAATIERGLGSGANADEITSAYAAMRSAVDSAVPILCKAQGPPTPAPAPTAQHHAATPR